MSEEEKAEKGLLNTTMSRKGFVAMTGAAGLAAFLAVHGAPRARLEEVFHQLGSALAQRILQALVGAGGIAVKIGRAHV